MAANRALIVATVNRKGGVGKTSAVRDFAHFLMHFHDKKVLVLDMDPQANLSTNLMGESEWFAHCGFSRQSKERTHTKPTVEGLFSKKKRWASQQHLRYPISS